MFALSLSFKTAELALRESFVFDEAKALDLLHKLKKSGIDECVYLSTCNRCELYGTGDVYKALDVFLEYSGNRGDAKSHILIFDNEAAVRHLFRVACGLESMVKGEDEILGQIKTAYAFSLDNALTGYELNTIFKAAITCAKRIKTQTLVSKSSVSVATLAAAKCHKFKDSGKTVLMIGGSGEIGGKVLKNLLSYGDFTIYATARERLIANDKIKVIPYAQRYEHIDEADIVISATKSPHFTVVADKLRKGIKNTKPRLFIDLAVPRDVDSEIGNISGITLITIDDFNETAKKNGEIKESELKTAEELMNGDIDELLKELYFHVFLPKFQRIESDELKRFIYRFRDKASAKEFESFIRVFEKTESTQ